MHFQNLFCLLRTYGSISPEEEAGFRRFFRVRTVAKKEILIKSDSPCNLLFFVNSGYLRAFYTDEKGREITRMIAWKGRFITNISSFKNDNQPNNECYECIADAEILCVTKQDFDALMQTSLNLKSIYADVLEEYNALHLKRFQEINMTDIKQKMQRLKDDYPHLITTMNDSVLASFLAISRETFVRNKEYL